MNERTIRDEAGKTWSVMVRRVSPEGSASSERAWAVCFRLQGDPTTRTLTQIVEDSDRPDLAEYSDPALLEMLEPHASRRSIEEARLRAEAEAAKAAARVANAAAKQAKTEASQARTRQAAADDAANAS